MKLKNLKLTSLRSWLRPELRSVRIIIYDYSKELLLKKIVTWQSVKIQTFGCHDFFQVFEELSCTCLPSKIQSTLLLHSKRSFAFLVAISTLMRLQGLLQKTYTVHLAEVFNLLELCIVPIFFWNNNKSSPSEMIATNGQDHKRR